MPLGNKKRLLSNNDIYACISTSRLSLSCTHVAVILFVKYGLDDHHVDDNDTFVLYASSAFSTEHTIP